MAGSLTPAPSSAGTQTGFPSRLGHNTRGDIHTEWAIKIGQSASNAEMCERVSAFVNECRKGCIAGELWHKIKSPCCILQHFLLFYMQLGSCFTLKPSLTPCACVSLTVPSALDCFFYLCVSLLHPLCLTCVFLFCRLLVFLDSLVSPSFDCSSVKFSPVFLTSDAHSILVCTSCCCTCGFVFLWLFHIYSVPCILERLFTSSAFFIIIINPC